MNFKLRIYGKKLNFPKEKKSFAVVPKTSKVSGTHKQMALICTFLIFFKKYVLKQWY